MDEPIAEEQPYGRRFQYGKRIVYAGNTAIAERIFRESANQILVQKETMERLDKCSKPV